MTVPDSSDPVQASFLTTLRAAQQGDVEATEDLFRQFYQQVRRAVHHSLSTDLRNSRPWLTARFSTGDVVQDVFRSVLSDLGSFGGETERAFSGYLAMVVRNRIIDAIRFHEAERRDGRIDADLAAAAGHSTQDDSPERQAESAEAFEALQAALGELTAKEQLLMRARFDGSATFEELKERLGYSSAASARRAFFALQAQLAVRLKNPAEGQS